MKNPEITPKLASAVEELAARFPECRVLVILEEEDREDWKNLHIHIQATMGKDSVTALLAHVLTAQRLAEMGAKAQKDRDAAEPQGN